MMTEIVRIPAETLDLALARADEIEARGDRREAIRILQIEIPESFAGDMQTFVRSGEQLARLGAVDEADDVLRTWSRGHAAESLDCS